ncbi:MAG: metal ABC transporter substrate-binding protein [Clostridia bacterium]|nr:metal ABC transporter substrate-binding protein [Clostridia bacterium]
MKKLLNLLLVLTLCLTTVFSITGCGPNDQNVIKVGASPTPHAEILRQCIEPLKAKGYTLEIVEFDDYVLPNTSVEDGQTDANYFQHLPYLNDFNKNNKTNIVSVCAVHYEPFAIYGKNVTIDDFNTNKTGRTILIPDDGSNGTRALFLLQEQGYITLKQGVSASDTLTVLDIADSKGNTVTAVTASEIPAQLNVASNGTLGVVNGNYALSAGLKVADALALESASGEAAILYANILAVKSGNENSQKILALKEVLLSVAIKNFINDTYNGAVLSVVD